ncbi:hypothetical protein JW826_04130 [Candidatus Woesearchaeota archaeon]|nr:hypothetical protein [Candidatus Woesearchaeota archaeon]
MKGIEAHLEEMEKLKGELAAKTMELAAAMKAGIEKQKDVWKKIPRLALLAEGRCGGRSHLLFKAFSQRRWVLHITGHGPERTEIYIDLDTGELRTESDYCWCPASPELTAVAACHAEHLDAEKIADDLKRIARAPLEPGVFYSEDHYESTIAKRKRDFGMLEQMVTIEQ